MDGKTDGDLRIIQSIVRAAGCALYVLDRQSGTLRWLDSDRSILGSTALANAGSGVELTALIGGNGSRAREQWMRVAPPDSTFRTVFFVCPEDGDRDASRWFEDTLAHEGAGERFIGMLRDITAIKEREARLDYLASYDQLTGQLNRTRLREYLARSIAYALRYGTPSSFLTIGVDNLSGINEAYGFDIADEVIAWVGRQVESMLRASDVVGRIANAKFGLILGRSDMRGAETVARRLQISMRENIIHTQAGAVAATVSVGAVLIPEQARTTHDVITCGLEALSMAKESGPDSFAHYSSSPQRLNQRRRNIAIAEQVMTAVEEKRVLLAYQPVVCAEDTRKVRFHESLIRMMSRDRGYISAGEFMPITEKLGLVRMLDRKTLTIVFDTLRRAPDVTLSLNISPQSVLDDDWHNSFNALAQQHPEALARLIVEITEASAIHDLKRTARFINGLRQKGCRLALDDFGAGYTSFRHLKELKFDMVKIDGTFIRGLPREKDNQLFVRTLTAIAKNFNMTIVAEFVGSDEEAAMLRDMGVDYLQGFHFGQPETDPAWLEDQASKALSA